MAPEGHDAVVNRESQGSRDTAFPLVLLIYCLYAGLFIYRTSFVIHGERHFCLFDDAMISMTYAKNIAHGYGLVWNVGGERVEGFTNPLWVFLMTPFHLLPIAPAKMSLPIQIVGGGMLAVNLLFVRKIAEFLSPGSRLASLGAVIATASYLPLNYWGLEGMEVSALALIVSVAVWQFMKAVKGQEFSGWPYVWLGLGTLIRVDMIVPLASMALFFAFFGERHRSRHLLVGFGIAVASLALQTLARIWYFGDILPNTYYLKMTGYPLFLRVGRGFIVISSFILYMNPLLFFLPLLLLRLRRDVPMRFLFWVLMTQVVYSLYVGGDAWEWWGGSNRYVSIAMPLFFILFCCTLAELRHVLTTVVRGKSQLANQFVIVVFMVAIVNFNAFHGHESLAQWLLLQSPYHTQQQEDMVKRGLLLKKTTRPKASIAVVWAGAIPYFADRYAVDLLGKCDNRIAHLKMRKPTPVPDLVAFNPGHMKWDYGYSIGQLKPDAVVQIAPDTMNEAKPYLMSDYKEVSLEGFTLYLRKNSRQILWDEVGAL